MRDDFDRLLDKNLSNPEFKKEWDALGPEFAIVQVLIDARKKNHLTQKELSLKTGINQADISKLENGNANPTIALLQRLAEGMDMAIKLEFVPKGQQS